MNRPTYRVDAVKREGWWLLTSPDAPGAVSQVRTLGQATEHAREAIAFVLGVAENSFDVTVLPELPRPLQVKVSRAKRTIHDLERLQRETAAASRVAVRELAAAGYRGIEIAAVLGVSAQRVSQLSKVSAVEVRQQTAAPLKPAAATKGSKVVPASETAARKPGDATQPVGGKAPSRRGSTKQ